MKQPAVYIMANKRNGTLYTGVTSNLVQRAWQHREGLIAGFSRRCGCKRLVWFGLEEKKLALIEGENAEWRDLYEDIAQP